MIRKPPHVDRALYFAMRRHESATPEALLHILICAECGRSLALKEARAFRVWVGGMAFGHRQHWSSMPDYLKASCPIFVIPEGFMCCSQECRDVLQVESTLLERTLDPLAKHRW